MIKRRNDIVLKKESDMKGLMEDSKKKKKQTNKKEVSWIEIEDYRE